MMDDRCVKQTEAYVNREKHKNQVERDLWDQAFAQFKRDRIAKGDYNFV
jgi:hypothetical protein